MNYVIKSPRKSHHGRTQSFDYAELTPLKVSAKKAKKTRCTSMTSPAEIGRIMSNRKKNDSRNNSMNRVPGRALFPEKGPNPFLQKKRAMQKAEKKKKRLKVKRKKEATEKSNKLSRYMTKHGHKFRVKKDVMESIKNRMGVWIEGEIDREAFRKEDEAAERIKTWYFKTVPMYKEFQKHWKKKREELYGKSPQKIDYSSSSGSDLSAHDPFEILTPPKRRCVGRVGDRFKKAKGNNNGGDCSDTESDYMSDEDDHKFPLSTRKESDTVSNSFIRSNKEEDKDESNFTEEILRKMGMDKNGILFADDDVRDVEGFSDEPNQDDEEDVNYDDLNLSEIIVKEGNEAKKEQENSEEAELKRHCESKFNILNITPCTIPSAINVGQQIVLDTPGVSAKIQEEIVFAEQLEQRAKSRQMANQKKLLELAVAERKKKMNQKKSGKTKKKRVVTKTTTIQESRECCTIL